MEMLLREDVVCWFKTSNLCAKSFNFVDLSSCADSAYL